MRPTMLARSQPALSGVTPVRPTLPISRILRGPLSNNQITELLDVIHSKDFSGDKIFGPLRGLTLDYSQAESLLLTVPLQVRKKIYSFLPKKEFVTLQRVCRQIRKEIVGKVGIRAYVTGNTYAGPVFMRDVKVDSLFVTNYERPLYSPYGLLTYPGGLRELIFYGPIGVNYFDGFLRKCKQIQVLQVVGNLVTILPSSSRFKTDSKYEWRSMSSIMSLPPILFYLHTVTLILPANINRESFAVLLRSLELTTWLENFTVIIGRPGEPADPAKFHAAILLFLESRNRPKFSQLAISVFQDKPSYRFTDHEHYLNVSIDKIIKISEENQLKQIILTEPSVDFQIWILFLMHQRQLESLQVLHLMYYGIHHQIILQNRNTLTKVAIHTILFEKPDRLIVLDLLVFSRCKHLRELFICIGVPRLTGATMILNFHHLPRKLEVLNLRQASVATLDFACVLDLPKLKCLGLLSQTNTGSFGMTLELYMKLLRKRSLNEMLISKFTVEDPEEMKKLRAVIRVMKSRVNKLKDTTYLGYLESTYWKYNSPGHYLHTVHGKSIRMK